MLRFTSIVLVLALLGLLTACGGSPAPSDTTGSQPSAVAVTEVATTAPATATTSMPEETIMPSPDETTTSSGKEQSLDLVVALTRSGGLQGRTQTLMVRGDGTLALLNGEAGSTVFKTGRASAAQLQALDALLASAEWQQLDEQYGRQVPDGFAYSVTGGGKRVTTYDGAQNPPVLENVLGKLNELWQAAQSGS